MATLAAALMTLVACTRGGARPVGRVGAGGHGVAPTIVDFAWHHCPAVQEIIGEVHVVASKASLALASVFGRACVRAVSMYVAPSVVFGAVSDDLATAGSSIVLTRTAVPFLAGASILCWPSHCALAVHLVTTAITRSVTVINGFA